MLEKLACKLHLCVTPWTYPFECEGEGKGPDLKRPLDGVSPRFTQPRSIILLALRSIFAPILFLNATISAVNADMFITLVSNLNFDTISESLAGIVTGKLAG